MRCPLSARRRWGLPHACHRSFAASRSPKVKELKELYERKSPIEHILLRPGMYVGAKEPVRAATWLYDDATKRMVKDTVDYIPALFKVFDEILVNAADNRQRDKSTSLISVDIDPGLPNVRPPRISVCNDGRGIPIEMHSKEGMYVPELVFGHLLTGSNFDDSEGRLTGGRHGYGAKLANIFSSRFEIETVNPAAGLRYRQEWRNNMRERGEPEVTPLLPEIEVDPGDASAVAAKSGTRGSNDAGGSGSGSGGIGIGSGGGGGGSGSGSDLSFSRGPFTRVTFEPDLAALGVEGGRISEDDVRMMRRRVVDVAGCSAPVRVMLDGELVKVASFEDYVRLYVGSSSSGGIDVSGVGGSGGLGGSGASVGLGGGVPLVCAKVNSRWDLAVAPSPEGSFEHVSFVNGMATPRGGTHVTHVAAQLTRRLADIIARKHTDLEVTPAVVRPHLFLFVRGMVENPSFDSQMKEGLTTRPAAFGSRCVLSDRTVRDIAAYSGVVERVVAAEREKQQRRLRRRAGSGGGGGAGGRSRQLLGVAKLEDAHRAGTAEGRRCTLILTEGDSAKALAVAGLEVVGREFFGVFPLRGKFLNVRDAGLRQVAENVEVGHLCTILGLDFSKTYENGPDASMRYGRVMLMADQDHDGSHIKGLLINFFHRFWPKLLASEGFLQQFVTPILKASPRSAARAAAASSAADGRGAETRVGGPLPFFSVPEFEGWRREQGISAAEFVRRWSVKYYKGLGTSTSAEARQYFSELSRHVKTFDAAGSADGDAIDMAFSKARAAERRDWLLTRFRPGAFLPTEAERVGVADFVNTELIQFSHADNVRSIPSALDGLKPSQRKVLYACFKRKLRSEVKVAQLAGYVSEHTAYHHGEASLSATIVGMAQDFVGSNNAPLLHPGGQFGTRVAGGKDSASARYIFTHLSKLARLLFPEEDDPLLMRRDDDGIAVEPVAYVPVVPLLLINGSQGIGTGWSTGVPAHNPLDVVDNTLRLLNGLSPLPLKPWVRGFRGRFYPRGPSVRGVSLQNIDGEAAALLQEEAEATAAAAAAAAEGDVVTGEDDGEAANVDDENLEGDPEERRGNAKGKGSNEKTRTAASYVSEGVVERHGKNAASVTELPVGRWTSDYKEVLGRLVESGVIRSFNEAHTQARVRFDLQLEADAAAASDTELRGLLRLRAAHSAANMHAFDAEGRIRRFRDAVEILEHSFEPRLELYRRRRLRLVASRAFAARHAANRERFVEAVRSGVLRIVGGEKTRRELETSLRDMGFEPLPALLQARGAAMPPLFGPGPLEDETVIATVTDVTAAVADVTDAMAAEEGTAEEGELLAEEVGPVGSGGGGGGSGGGSGSGGGKAVSHDFDYLLDMTLASFTSERLMQLRHDVEAAERALAEVTACLAEDLWLNDLAALRRELLRDPEYAVNRDPAFAALAEEAAAAAAGDSVVAEEVCL